MKTVLHENNGMDDEYKNTIRERRIGWIQLSPKLFSATLKDVLKKLLESEKKGIKVSGKILQI